MSTLAAVPPPPREPSPRARKLIYAYAGSQAVLLLVGAIFFLVGAPLSLIFCRSLPGELALTVLGTPASATVESTRLQTNVRVNGVHPTEVVFTFDGHRVESSTLEPGGLGPGATAAIEYVPGKPEWARLRGGSYGTFPVWVGFVLLFPLVGAVLVAGAVRSNRREIRAFRDGHATSGRVTNVGLDRSVRVNGRHPLKVDWTFEVLGRQFEGSLSSLDPEQLRDFRSGDQVTVLYDPDQPKVNTVWVDG